MPSSTIRNLDRLSVHSVLRGSTATICGIIGTITVIILCLAIYIPVADQYVKGDYYESQLFHQRLVDARLYSNRDFKIAVQFVNRNDNSVANHSELLTWAYSDFAEQLADYSAYYYEEAWSCRPDYFADAINPVELKDCFIFPENSLLDMFADYGVYTRYSNIYYWFTAQDSIDPFTSAFAGTIGGNYRKLDDLLNNYYYVVYFTSKLMDRGTGQPQFQVNRFYSSESSFNTDQGGAVDLMVYHLKEYKADVSIMPWRNNITEEGLVWLGRSDTLYQGSDNAVATNGIQINWSFDKYHITSHRYYKKLDWLLGIIGGAMLLFYIILWVPCNYINRTKHKKDNVNYFLLLNHQLDENSKITQNSLTAANVSNWYYISNPITNCFMQQPRKASRMVMAGQLQLDIVALVKKLKVTQRSLKKKQLWKQFKPKVYDMQTIQLENVPESNRRDQERDQQMSSENRQSVDSDNIVDEEIVPEDLVDLPVDPTFGFTDGQRKAIDGEIRLKNIYENNMVGTVLTQGQEDNTSRLLDLENKSKHKAKYQTRRRTSKVRKFINFIGDKIEYCDFFGVRPNLQVNPYGSSFVGICGTLLIIVLSILLVALTVANMNSIELMIDYNYQEDRQFDYELLSGDSLKFAMCFSQASNLIGSGRQADLKFFTETEQGRQYYQAEQLSSTSYELFDTSSLEQSIPLEYCFTMPNNIEVQMGQNYKGSQYGYFGFRVEPVCFGTTLYCQQNVQLVNDNFLSLINYTVSDILLPQNRYDQNSTSLKSNLVNVPLNLQLRYLNNQSALEQTIYVDHVRIRDNTQNWFVRSEAVTKQQGITANHHTLDPLSKSIPGSPYYQVKIRPSNNQINYILNTKKADIVLGIIGGVFVLMYAIFHWFGKIYNNFLVRARLAQQIYYQESINESPLNKFLAIAPIPKCMLPSCCHIRNDVMRMRQIEKKIQNDLNYVWLVRYTDTIFNLSSSLFDRIQEKNLSLVYVKEKLDESQPFINRMEVGDRNDQDDFMELDDEDTGASKKLLGRKGNKVVDQSMLQNNHLINESHQNLPDPTLRQTTNFEKFKIDSKYVQQENGKTEKLNDNHQHGLPKQPFFNWLDTFEYPASLTFKGKRQVTSCCGGCCCIILLILVIIVGAFQVAVYIDRDDSKVSMTTAMMQPLQQNQNSTFNSMIHFETGNNFKLALTFSSQFADYPHDVSNWTFSAVGISIFKQTFTRHFGTVSTQVVEIPMVPCASDYLTSWLNPITDESYYTNTQYGYCVPDGISLEIDGLPEDSISRRFTLSIYNKLRTASGNTILKSFMEHYLPKFHVSNPQLDRTQRKFDYYMTSFTFDAFNVTYPVSQNISIEKVAVLYDDQLAFEGDSYVDIAYGFTQFHFRQTQFYNQYSDTAFMSYNLSFANNYNVRYFQYQNQKFASTFGIIGGLVAFFIFGLGCCARSFNTYRMHYLIGKQLYLFDLLKKKQARQKARGRLRKTKEQRNQLSDINNYNELQILKAYLLSFIAGPTGWYNFDETLRRVSLIQQKVETDISLFEVYKKLHLMRDILNDKYNFTKVPICDLYLKKIYHPDPDTSSLTDMSKLIAFAKKNSWSSWQQFAVFQAFQSKVNLKAVFDNAFLEKELNMYHSDSTSIHLSQFGGTQGTFGTNSMISGNMSEMHREQEEIIPDEA